MSLRRLSLHTFFFWGVALLAVIAELCAILLLNRHFHQKDSSVMPLFVLTMAVLIIWISYFKLHSGLSTLTQHVDRELLGRLQMAVDTIGVFANVAIVMGFIALSPR